MLLQPKSAPIYIYIYIYSILLIKCLEMPCPWTTLIFWISAADVWNLQGYLWNSAQNVLPVYWKMQCLHNVTILRALRFNRSEAFWKHHHRPELIHPAYQLNPLTGICYNHVYDWLCSWVNFQLQGPFKCNEPSARSSSHVICPAARPPSFMELNVVDGKIYRDIYDTFVMCIH